MKNDEQYLRMPDLLEMLKISKASVYNFIRERGFPSPIKIGPKCSVWRESEVRAWIESQAVDEAA